MLLAAPSTKQNLNRELTALGERLTDKLFPLVRAALAGAGPHPKLGKAEGDDDSTPTPGLQPDGSIVTQMGTVVPASQVAEILAAIADEDFALVEGVLTPDVIEAFKKAGYTEVQRITTFSQDPKDILEVLDKDAVAYAEERGGELITQLSEATRDKVRGTIEDALTEGWSKQEFSAELQANYAFSPQRADMIAHTELAFAHSYGRVEPMKAGGATKKKWLLSADHDPDEDCYCSEAAEAGWVDIDDNFVDDDDYDYPPGHPNCWCDWVSNLAGGDEEDDDDGGDDGAGPDEGDDGGAVDKAAGLSQCDRCAVGKPSSGELHKAVRDIFARLERLRARRDPDGIERDQSETLPRINPTGSDYGEGHEAGDDEELADDPESPTSAAKALSGLTKYPIDDKAHEAALSPRNAHPEPTSAQRRAGNYKMGHIVVGGLPIAIENPAGTPRKPGWTEIQAHYGYFNRTTGADGDHLDVFVRPGTDHEWAGTVYIVDQFKLDGTFDEHKVLLGYDSKEAAVQAYLGSYQAGWKLGPVSSLSWGAFIEWMRGDISQPVYLSTHVMKGDVDGHPFHGNQYTDGTGGGEKDKGSDKGPKPTATTVAGAKGGVHELLSSGHSFTLDELQHATGASLSNLKTALSDLKSDKYAGKYGKLEITKNPDGSYQVKSTAGAAKPITTSVGHVAGAKEDVPAAKPEAAAKPVTGYEDLPHLVQPSSNAEHDKVYAAKLNVALVTLNMSAGTEADIKAFKDTKAQAMAEWQYAAHGDKSTPKEQQVFQADKNLVANLNKGMSNAAAYAQWKNDTAAEKAGTLYSSGKPISSSEVTSSAHLGEGVGKPSAESSRGIPTDTAVGVAPIGVHEFAADTKDVLSGKSAFSEGLEKLHNALSKDSLDAKGNKISVEKQLAGELKDSPNFQALKEAYAKSDSSGGYSLEAKLVQTWAASSGDSNDLSVAMQLAAKEVFGMKDNEIATSALGSLQSHGSTETLMTHAASAVSGTYLNDYKDKVPATVMHEGLKEFVAGMYRNTQSWLASRGITELYVARGMHIDPAAAVSIRNVKLQPMSSFSTSLSVASGFGGSGNVYITRVPASQVIGSYRTGYGCSNEHEVVVLAHRDMKAVELSTDALEVNAHGSYKTPARNVSAYIQAKLEENAKYKGGY